jgi:putative Ca2+/H+ antiporter (TMEM165/GDT1 family)
MRAYAAVFVSVFLAELGDKTQLATLLFAATPGLSKAGVFAAAASALLASSALAVLVGGHVGAALRPELLRTLTAAAFIAIGGWMLLSR